MSSKEERISKPVKPTGLPPEAQKRADAIALRTELKIKRLEIAKKLASDSIESSDGKAPSRRINCLTPFLEEGLMVKLPEEKEP